jgi:hypothetical protein
MRRGLENSLRRRDGSPRVRAEPTSQRLGDPLLRLQQTVGNQAALRALTGFRADRTEVEADRVAESVAAVVAPSLDVAPAGQDGAGSGERLAPSLRGRLETFLGRDLGAVRIHAGAAAGREARALGARAFTRGSDVFFSPGSFRPETRAGIGLLGHELAHVHQQSAGRAPWATVQKKEDWDFTPADYKALLKGKKELRFGPDSAWLPKALQDNLLTTLKFTLTSTKPVRTEGVNVNDFYHGHFVVPKGKMASLSKMRTEFRAKSDELQAKALGGSSADLVTTGNLAAYTKALQETEKLATPLIEEALKIEGAAVIYHTFEVSDARRMNLGSPTRNIRTIIGGTPEGYDPSGKEVSADQYTNEYYLVLEFGFLVDETGVIHVTAGTNLSGITGTPLF